MHVSCILDRISGNQSPHACSLRFQNAMITVRRALTAEFHYQLVVTRLFEEGEELLLDEEDESVQVVFTA